jgi:hypothetical protein
MSCHQTAGHHHTITIANRCFENVAEFRYLEMTVTGQYMIHREIKEEIKFG